jgi:acetyltransferase-like isoleucine patch superfamily enzyme
MEALRLEHDWFSWPLPNNVKIGNNTWLYSSFAFLHYRSRLPDGVVIGSNTGVYNGTFFDLGPKGSAKIGDYCTIVGGIFSSNGEITFGDYVFVAHEVVIADSAFATPQRDDTVGSPEIVVGDNVWIGARATILGGASIGEGSVIGAASVVDFEVPPLSLVAGNPARVVKTLLEGARDREGSKDAIPD